MFGRRRYFGRGSVRRLIGLALVLSTCASFLPLPIAINPSTEKDRSQPFPCQNRPCGCASAEQCWRQCCCFTNAEKVAWARANGVTPPEFVVEAAREESDAKIDETDVSPRKICSRCKKSTDDSGSNVCCESQNRSACCSSSEKKQHQYESDTEDSLRYVIGIEMMKCRGQGQFWNSLPWAVISVVQMPKFEFDPETWDHPCSFIAVSVVAEPPEPPPRLA